MAQEDETKEAAKEVNKDDIRETQTPTPPVMSNAEQIINRRSRWLSSWAAFCYVSTIAKDDEVKVRDSDRVTALALLVCCVVALICLLVPQLEAHRFTCVLATDGLVGLSVLMYLANRFGIITTFHPRQALLTWQLMLGSSLLGIFLAINFALVLAAFITGPGKLAIPQ